jgi:hypothetical protein
MLDKIAIKVVLLNFSKEDREHDPFIVLLDTGQLALSITGPDGKPLPGYGAPSRPRDPFTVKNKLRPGEWASDLFGVGAFGYFRLDASGRYRMTARLWIDGKTVTSPPIEFEVAKVPAYSVLVSQDVPLEGAALKPPVGKRYRVTVQQVKIGNRFWLVYRRFHWGGGVFCANRIVELPHPVEMKVEGAYGAWNPLTIQYKDPNSKTGWTKLVVQSGSGLPWTEEEERARIERAKKAPLASQPVRP